MPRSNRGSLLRAVLAVLMVQVFAFSTVGAVVLNDNQTARNLAPEKTTVQRGKKSSKKRKKKRTTSVWLPSVSTIFIPQPVVSLPARLTPPSTLVTPLQTLSRPPVRVARIPTVHVLPVKNPNAQDEPPEGFTNPAPIVISDSNTGPGPEPASPYSSDIEVSGLTGFITGLSVTIHGLTHPSPDDLDMLLVAPGGQSFHFWSDVGGDNAVDDVTVVIADSGVTPLPDSDVIVDGETYKPFNADTTGDTFPAPAPSGPYGEPDTAGTATFASIFNGLSAAQANGTWKLFITDDADGNGGVIAQGWSLNITTGFPVATTGQLVISEFRLSGPGGDDDEFIEIYNTSGAPLTVQDADRSGGLGIAASDGNTRCIIPNGTVFPAQGHFLCAHSSSSVAMSADATYAAGISENAGIAIFNTSSGGGNYRLESRLDAAGSTSETDEIYKEGDGYSPISGAGLNYSFYRDLRPNGAPKDSNDNGADFLFVETNGADAGAGQRLGTPGPQNLSSPTQQNGNFPATLISPCVAASAYPNRLRDFASDSENNSTQGTLSIRRLITNSTANPITQLRFRIIDISTFPAPAGGVADLRVLTSMDSIEADPCQLGGLINLMGLTLDDPQPLGGGFNSTLSAGTITLATPLAPNASISVNFLLGVQQTGNFKFYVNIEALQALP